MSRFEGWSRARTVWSEMRRRRRELRLSPELRAPLLAVGILIAVMAVWSAAKSVAAPSPASAADPIVIFKNPRSSNLWLCDDSVAPCDGVGEGELVIREEVANIPPGDGLGSFEFRVFYPRDIVDIEVSEGPFLGSTGRTTQCQSILVENWLQFGCVSTGSAPGPTGSGVLAYLTVRPNRDLVIRPAYGNGIFVRLINDKYSAELADELGDPIPVEEVRHSTVLLRALEGDVNYDCRVNVIDEQALSVRYGSVFGTWPYQTFYDLEPYMTDSDIDIKDLQFIYGRDGSTCDAPIPNQPSETPTPTATPGAATSTPTATAVGTPTVTSTPGGNTATPTPSGGTTPTLTPTPTATTAQTPVATNTPGGTPTETMTPGGNTATPTPSSGTTPTATSTPTATTAQTPVATNTPGGTAIATPSPTRTPSSHRTNTPVPTAEASATPTPSAGTPDATVSPTATPLAAETATPTPEGGAAPSDRTPGPDDDVAPGQRQRTPMPGEAEGLPGAGFGSDSDGSAGGGLLLLTTMLAVAGWSMIVRSSRIELVESSETDEGGTRRRRRD